MANHYNNNNRSGDFAWNSSTVSRPKMPNPLRSLVYSPDEEILGISDLEIDDATMGSSDNAGSGTDRFQNRFQSARSAFENWEPSSTGSRQHASPRSPSSRSSVSGGDANNNSSTRYSATTPPSSRLSWDGSTPSSSRRSSESSIEFNERQRRTSEIAVEMAAIRERIAESKTELSEASERRTNAEQGYEEAKDRIGILKKQSKSLRDEIRSTEGQIEWKEKKLKEAKKKLENVTMRIEQNDRSAAFYDKDIRNESGLLEKTSEKLEATRERRKVTIAKIRELAPRLKPLKKAINAAEGRTEDARARSRRLQDILNKSTIRLRNRQALSAQSSKRISFKGCALDDAQRAVSEAKERAKRARSNVGYLEYRKQLLREQIEEYQRDLRGIVIRLNPHMQQRALGFQYTRLPMSEEL